MIPSKPIGQRLTILLLSFFLFSYIKVSAQDGQALFMSKCASCHAANMTTNLTGPALAGVEERWPEKDKLHAWIRNSTKLIKTGYERAVQISTFSPSEMTRQA